MNNAVPVIEINRDNLSTFWPTIIFSLRNSYLIALDAWLFTPFRSFYLRSVDDRYTSTASAAVSRSVLSIGLSCFSLIDENQGENLDDENPVFSLKCVTYNFLALCDDDFVVEPAALRFLVDHGFDFNLQYAKGLPYSRTAVSHDKEPVQFSLKLLIKEIFLARRSCVFHNGFVDLIYLYGNFLGDLPSTLQTFVADVAELFPAGVYDTKFVADFGARFDASYLEYVFLKCKRENIAAFANGAPSVEIRFSDCLPSVERWVEWAAFTAPRTTVDIQKIEICTCFAAHGWCKDGRQCTLSHDVDIILDLEEMKAAKKRSKKRKRCRKLDDSESVSSISIPEETDPKMTESKKKKCRREPADGKAVSEPSPVANCDKLLPKYSGAHRAGYDAFMTGFSLIYLCLKLGQISEFSETRIFEAPLFKDKIALSGKDYPLLIQASAFAKPSQIAKNILSINQ